MRTLIAVALAVLALGAPASAAAQDAPPASLFEAAPAHPVGTADPTDGGRSTLLLALALVAVVGAGALAGVAILRPRRAAAPPVAAPPDRPAVAPEAPAPPVVAARAV